MTGATHAVYIYAPFKKRNKNFQRMQLNYSSLSSDGSLGHINFGYREEKDTKNRRKKEKDDADT